MMSTHRFLFATTGVFFALAAACSADQGSSDNASSNSSSNDGGAGTGGNGTGADPGTGGSGNFNPVGGSSAGGGDTCAAEEAQAEVSTLNIVVVLDRSASMDDSGQWTPVVAALKDFFNDANSAGINVAMNFFPIANPPDNNACNPAHYTTPAVPFSAIPVDAATLNGAMDGQVASGPDTPTYGALYGSLQYANTYEDTFPDEVTIVVFASDGDPNGCPGNQNDISEIANVAQSAYNYNGVRTFVIAIQGATIANLNQIAMGGGTGQAFDVTSDTSLFKQKMEEIRAQALACEFLIPEPSNPNEFDPLEVNVEYTPGGSATPQDLPQADDQADCGNQPGWYYDNPSNPTKIFLCPASCATIQADAQANVKFLFGCPTKFN